MAANDETLPITEYAVRKLGGYGLSHLLLMGNTTDSPAPLSSQLIGRRPCSTISAPSCVKLIANVGMAAEERNRLIAEGIADLVRVWTTLLANPYLFELLATALRLPISTGKPSTRRDHAAIPTIR